MANNYFEMTGVLVLHTVTPVIKALFGIYELNENFPGNGEAYIADIAESTNGSWDDVLENLRDLVTNLGLSLPDDADDNMEEHLFVLASYFGADDNEQLTNLIEHANFDESAGIDSLFTIARAFDDGHGLKAYKTESSWRCSKPRLFEFGGAGEFAGVHVAVGTWSRQAIELGEALETALENSDTDKAASVLREKVASILAGIHSNDARDAIRSKLSDLLTEPTAPANITAPTEV